MIDVRPFASLGHADHGWLDARHHFAFADYHDADRTHWGGLRVWNDDAIAPGAGFPPHPHRDMEIVTYVREGAISHRDSLGNSGRTAAGDVQVMSSGSGIAHAEYNAEDVTTRLFQIWIVPERRGLSPSWGTRPFPTGDRSGRFVALASGRPDAEDALPIRADASVLGAAIGKGETVRYVLDPGRHAYLVAAVGALEVNGVRAGTRDGVAITGETELEITALEDSEVVLVDAA